MRAERSIDPIKVARLYYEESKTQEEIARRLRISRPRVSKLLNQARKQGIVRITIIDPTSRHRELESGLKERFGLSEAIVVPGEMNSDELSRPRIGQSAARYLETILRDGEHVGVGWGRTLHELVQALHPSQPANAHFIPLLGGLGRIPASFQSQELARGMAEALGGTWQSFYAPAMAESEEILQVIIRPPEIRQVIDQWKQLDVAVVGISNAVSDLGSPTSLSNCLDAATQSQLRIAGAVGEICLRFFNGSGELCKTGGISLVGIGPDSLCRIPRVVGVAGGHQKVEAIFGALRGSFLHVLITDETAARGVMEFGH